MHDPRPSDLVVEIPFGVPGRPGGVEEGRALPYSFGRRCRAARERTGPSTPPVFKKYVEFHRLPREDNINDLDRLTRELRKTHRMSEVSVDFRMLKKLPAVAEGRYMARYRDCRAHGEGLYA